MQLADLGLKPCIKTNPSSSELIFSDIGSNQTLTSRRPTGSLAVILGQTHLALPKEEPPGPVKLKITLGSQGSGYRAADSALGPGWASSPETLAPSRHILPTLTLWCDPHSIPLFFVCFFWSLTHGFYASSLR